jgi:hypothetical protein
VANLRVDDVDLASDRGAATRQKTARTAGPVRPKTGPEHLLSAGADVAADH